MTAKPTDPQVAATPLPPDADRVVLGDPARTCDRVQGLLDEYLGGSLAELDRAGVEHHLALCATCRTAADQYFEVVRLARSLPPVDPPPEAEARLRALIGRALGRPEPGGG